VNFSFYNFNAFETALKGNNKQSFLAIFFLSKIFLKIFHSFGIFARLSSKKVSIHLKT